MTGAAGLACTEVEVVARVSVGVVAPVCTEVGAQVSVAVVGLGGTVVVARV